MLNPPPAIFLKPRFARFLSLSSSWKACGEGGEGRVVRVMWEERPLATNKRWREARNRPLVSSATGCTGLDPGH